MIEVPEIWRTDLSENPGEKEFGLLLSRLDSKVLPSLYTTPHRHDFQQIIVVQSGRGRHLIDGKLNDIRPRTVSLIAKGHVHASEKAVPATGWSIRFADDFLPTELVSQTWNYRLSLFNQLNPTGTLVLTPSQMYELELLLGAMESEYARHGTFQRQTVLRHLLSLLIVQIGRLHHATLSAHREQDTLSLYQQFMVLLEQDYVYHHDVQYYAMALRVDPLRLAKVLGRALGKSTKQLIEERIILEAKRCLSFTGMSVKEIAFAIGYHDLFHMSKIFKRVVGMSPQAYRDQRRQLT